MLIAPLLLQHAGISTTGLGSPRNTLAHVLGLCVYVIGLHRLKREIGREKVEVMRDVWLAPDYCASCPSSPRIPLEVNQSGGGAAAVVWTW